MAIFSPALVIAMSVMFILTQVHRYVFLFEVPLFFGLKYCQSPNQRLLEQVINSPGKPNLSVLPARRVKLDESFFAFNINLPYYRDVHYILCLSVAYVVASLFELFVSCRFPAILLTMRSSYVAIFIIAYITTQLWSISIFLSSTRVMLIIAALSTLATLVLLSLADPQVAFSALHQAIYLVLRSRIELSESQAEVWATRLSLVFRIVTVGFIAMSAASVIVPSRRFSLLDYRLRKDYLQEQVNENRTDSTIYAGDAYSLPPPTIRSMISVVMDYIGPVVCTAFAAAAVSGSYHRPQPMSLKAALLLAIPVVIRFVTMRLRLQAFLDGALDAFRRFSAMRATDANVAVRNLLQTVSGTVHYLPMIATAYIGPPIMITTLLLVSVVDGDVGAVGSMGRAGSLCRNVMIKGPGLPLSIFIGRMAGFAAWVITAMYAAFSMLSFAVEVATEGFSAGSLAARNKARARGNAEPTASQRRRMRRMMEATSNTSSSSGKR